MRILMPHHTMSCASRLSKEALMLPLFATRHTDDELGVALRDAAELDAEGLAEPSLSQVAFDDDIVDCDDLCQEAKTFHRIDRLCPTFSRLPSDGPIP